MTWPDWLLGLSAENNRFEACKTPQNPNARVGSRFAGAFQTRKRSQVVTENSDGHIAFTKRERDGFAPGAGAWRPDMETGAVTAIDAIQIPAPVATWPKLRCSALIASASLSLAVLARVVGVSEQLHFQKPRGGSAPVRGGEPSAWIWAGVRGNVDHF